LLKRFILNFFLVLALIIALLIPAFSENMYIQVIGERVNIRFENNLNSMIIAKARKGDIYKLKSEKGNWCEITLFSGESRYIHKSLGKIISYIPAFPESESTRQAIFHELAEAKNRAMKEANQKFPADIYDSGYKNINYAHILEDRYKLEIFHRYDVQPPIYWQLIAEAAKKDWKHLKISMSTL